MKRTLADPADAPAWLRFGRGLLTGSPLSGAVTVGVAVALLVAISIVFAPARWATKFHRTFLWDDDDHGLVLSSKLLKLHAKTEPKSRLFVTGASLTAHSIDEAKLAAQLAPYGMAFDEAYNLTLPKVRPAHLRVIVDHLPREGSGVLVIGLNPSRLMGDPTSPFRNDKKTQRLGVRSPSWSALAKDAGEDADVYSGIFLWDNRRFYLKRVKRGLRRWWEDEDPPKYKLRENIGSKARKYGDFPRLRKNFDKTRALELEERIRRQQSNLDTLRDIITAAREEHGLTVVLYRPPINPEFERRHKISDLAEPNWAALSALAAEMGVPTVSCPPMKEKDFHDQWHLRTRAALNRATEAVATSIGEALGQPS